MFDEVIAEFGKPVTVHRWANGSLVSGDYQIGPETTLRIVAAIQPIKGTLRSAATGGIVESECRLFSTSRVYGPSRDKPDEIEYDGDRWLVADVKTWELDGDKYYEALIARQKRP